MNFDEDKFRVKAEKEIIRCRPGDWQHALRVASWVKELGKDRKDLSFIIIAAYIHDIGWRDILPSNDKITLDHLLELENIANGNSRRFATQFLKSLGFSLSEIELLNRLIVAADKHSSCGGDEAVITDADSLSKLTIDHLKEKFPLSEWMSVYSFFIKTMPKRISTQKGKSLLPDLLRQLEHSIEIELEKTNHN